MSIFTEAYVSLRNRVLDSAPYKLPYKIGKVGVPLFLAAWLGFAGSARGQDAPPTLEERIAAAKQKIEQMAEKDAPDPMAIIKYIESQFPEASSEGHKECMQYATSLLDKKSKDEKQPEQPQPPAPDKQPAPDPTPAPAPAPDKQPTPAPAPAPAPPASRAQALREYKKSKLWERIQLMGAPIWDVKDDVWTSNDHWFGQARLHLNLAGLSNPLQRDVPDIRIGIDYKYAIDKPDRIDSNIEWQAKGYIGYSMGNFFLFGRSAKDQTNNSHDSSSVNVDFPDISTRITSSDVSTKREDTFFESHGAKGSIPVKGVNIIFNLNYFLKVARILDHYSSSEITEDTATNSVIGVFDTFNRLWSASEETGTTSIIGAGFTARNTNIGNIAFWHTWQRISQVERQEQYDSINGLSNLRKSERSLSNTFGLTADLGLSYKWARSLDANEAWLSVGAFLDTITTERQGQSERKQHGRGYINLTYDPGLVIGDVTSPIFNFQMERDTYLNRYNMTIGLSKRKESQRQSSSRSIHDFATNLSQLNFCSHMSDTSKQDLREMMWEDMMRTTPSYLVFRMGAGEEKDKNLEKKLYWYGRAFAAIDFEEDSINRLAFGAIFEDREATRQIGFRISYFIGEFAISFEYMFDKMKFNKQEDHTFQLGLSVFGGKTKDTRPDHIWP